MDIANFSKQLNSKSIAPKHIQFSNWQDWTIVSCFNEQSTQFISESVTMGIDKNSEIALMKSLTEFCERGISKLSVDPATTLTERSDGFAAFPATMPNATKHARNNAYNEAVERFLWSTWWDNLNTAYTIKEEYLDEDLNLLKTYFDLVMIYSITITSKNSDSSLLILLAENRHGGFITGGAAGSKAEVSKTFSRSFGELLRHLLVIDKMYIDLHDNLSFYEQRLWGFGSGSWNKVVKSRLNVNGTNIISLPGLVVDKEIENKHSDLIVLHRCLFENQPIFMGGNLERLCI